MDEIVNKVAEKTGVGKETVQKVLAAAVEFIKQKLPPQFASQVDQFVKSGGDTGAPASNPNPVSTLSGLLGGR